MSAGSNFGGGREFDVSDPVDSFVETVRGVLLEPREFFSGISTSGSLKNPLIFGLVCLFVSALLARLMGLLSVLGSGPLTMDRSLGNFTQGLGISEALLVVLLIIVVAPLSALLRLYIYSAIVHILVMIFVRNNLPFEATLRTYCYASAVALLGWIPWVGWIATLYGLYVLLVGLKEVHGSAQVPARGRG